MCNQTGILTLTNTSSPLMYEQPNCKARKWLLSIKTTTPRFYLLKSKKTLLLVNLINCINIVSLQLKVVVNVHDMSYNFNDTTSSCTSLVSACMTATTTKRKQNKSKWTTLIIKNDNPYLSIQSNLF